MSMLNKKIKTKTFVKSLSLAVWNKKCVARQNFVLIKTYKADDVTIYSEMNPSNLFVFLIK